MNTITLRLSASRMLAAAVALAALSAASETMPRHGDGEGFMVLVSPMAGYNRNEMTVQRGGPGGMQSFTETDTAPIFGLFAMAAHPRLVVNNFLFYTEPDSTDVLGNLFFANLYGDPGATLTWNLGAGHLYHEIKPDNEEIEVQVPMVKAGPIVRYKPWGLTFNPYLGYAWERIETLRADVDNDGLLYGLSVDWRWRQFNANVKYYYQDSREDRDNCNTVRARLVMAVNRHWGMAARFDYMEHITGDDTSLMLGPVFVF